MTSVGSFVGNGIIRARLGYGNVVWDPLAETSINVLEKVHQRHLRFIYGKIQQVRISHHHYARL